MRPIQYTRWRGYEIIGQAGRALLYAHANNAILPTSRALHVVTYIRRLYMKKNTACDVTRQLKDTSKSVFRVRRTVAMIKRAEILLRFIFVCSRQQHYARNWHVTTKFTTREYRANIIYICIKKKSNITPRDARETNVQISVSRKYSLINQSVTNDFIVVL